jgi:hypothetical protein
MVFGLSFSQFDNEITAACRRREISTHSGIARGAKRGRSDDPSAMIRGLCQALLDSPTGPLAKLCQNFQLNCLANALSAVLSSFLLNGRNKHNFDDRGNRGARARGCTAVAGNTRWGLK